MQKLVGLLGSLVIVGVVYLFTKDKKGVNWKSVGLAYVAQFILAFLLIKTPLWIVVEWLSNGMSWLLEQANVGIEFVFGGIAPDGFVFFINSLMPIVFVSAIMGLLFHVGIIQKVVDTLGRGIAKVFDIHPLVGINGIANTVMGQSDSLFLSKSYMPKASTSVVFATMVGGMSSISASVMGLYASYGVSLSWLLVSMPLTVLSTLVLIQIVMPTRYDANEVIEIEDERGVNFMETMLTFANAGFKAVVSIAVALMVFLSLVAMINSLIGLVIPGVTLEGILGVLFTPLAWLMGVPNEEVAVVAQLLGCKLATNEAVAFGLPAFGTLSESTKAMVTIALAGFGGVGSVGIMCGGYMAVAPSKVKVVAKLGAKALVVTTLVTILSACVVGVFL